MYILIKFNRRIEKSSENKTIRPETVNCTGFLTRLLQDKFSILDYSTQFVLTCPVLTDMVESSYQLKGKIISKMT